jgi:hypothetical protein
MKKIKPTILVVSVVLFWQANAHAFTVQCASAVRDDDITIACITTWGVGDVVAYNGYTIDSIAVTSPPAPLHTGQEITAGAVTISPNQVEHFIKYRPITAFWILNQKSTFRGVYICYENEGEPTPHPYSDTTIRDYGRLLQVGGSGSIVGVD